MRGKDLRLLLSWALIGITPAYAGKRVRPFHVAHGQRDHPRVCGEKRIPPHEVIRRLGSPPRMRGKEEDEDESGSTTGITPAYAGKRVLRPSPGGPDEDHPRVCGEKFKVSCYKPLIRGSPPRMRGKVIGLGQLTH